jgi:hypothetical protein
LSHQQTLGLKDSMKCLFSYCFLLAFFIIPLISQAQELEYVNSTGFAHATDIEVSGNYAYCTFYYGLQIFDISDATSPILISQLPSTPMGPCFGPAKITVSGNYAYIASWWRGLTIVDISNPTSPSIVGSYDDDGYAWDIFVSGHYAYIADGSMGLQIVDISNPTSPTPVGSYDTPYDAVRVYISGNYAFIAADYSGLYIINISNPHSPSLVNHWNVGWTESVFISGNYAYLGIKSYYDYRYRMFIIDIADPYNLRQIGSYNTSYMPTDISVSGHYAYLCDFSQDYNGVNSEVFDISNPSSPSFLATIDAIAEGIFINGGYAYIADPFYGNKIFNISNPANPTFVGGNRSIFSLMGVYIADSLVYLAGNKNGLQIINISNPLNPIPLGNFDTPGSAQNVFVQGDYAYVADISNLQIINISNPDSLVFTASLNQAAYNVKVVGNYAYITGDVFFSLLIVDVSDPSTPLTVAGFGSGSGNDGVFVRDNYLYLVNTNGLEIGDISIPSNPIMVSSCHTINPARDVFVSGSYAYIAEGHNNPGIGLQIIDISDLALPHIVGSLEVPGQNSYGIFVSDNYAFLASEYGGLLMIDISDPANPALLYNYDTPGLAYGVTGSGNYIYVADYFGLLILRQNITDIKDGDILPLPFTFVSNYPNPFNSFTTINYGLSSSGQVRIEMFDCLGRFVETLFNGYQQAGFHKIAWDAENRGTGTYFYRISAKSYSKTEKMILLK